MLLARVPQAQSEPGAQEPNSPPSWACPGLSSRLSSTAVGLEEGTSGSHKRNMKGDSRGPPGLPWKSGWPSHQRGSEQCGGGRRWGASGCKGEDRACPWTSAHSLLLGTEKQPGCGCAPLALGACSGSLLFPLGSVP